MTLLARTLLVIQDKIIWDRIDVWSEKRVSESCLSHGDCRHFLGGGVAIEATEYQKLKGLCQCCLQAIRWGLHGIWD